MNIHSILYTGDRRRSVFLMDFPENVGSEVTIVHFACQREYSVLNLPSPK